MVLGERLRGSNHPGHVAVMLQHMPRHHFVNLRFNCLRCNYRDMNGLHHAHRCCRTMVQLGKSVVRLIFLRPRLAAENHLCAPARASRHLDLPFIWFSLCKRTTGRFPVNVHAHEQANTNAHARVVCLANFFFNNSDTTCDTNKGKRYCSKQMGFN